MSSGWFTRLLLATMGALLLLPAFASADPSSRVARISFIGGSVSFRPASLDEWNVASLNYPLTVGDHLWTDRGARGELQLGSTVVRLAPLSEFSVLNLDDHLAQLRVTQGAVSVRVRALTDQDVVEIDTPNSAVSLRQPGLYRVDVSETGDSSTVTVREGEADVATGASAVPVGRGQSAVLAGVDAPRLTVQAAMGHDEFEDWSLTRDRRFASVQSVRYVSPEMIGAEDLDANGTWQVIGDYGPVWTPRVSAEWVPYRFGHWVWVEPWGWTWVDDAAWGFAPFHYGRWVFLPARGWAWVPGARVVHPVYAPALVAFVGGSTWSVSARLGSGPVGWFPLGPREVYVPGYRVTPAYVQRVNVAQVTNINVTTVSVTNITYVNRTVPNAVTAVSRETFVQARPVAAAAVAVPRDQAQAASIVEVAAVAPQQGSITGAPRANAVPPAAAVTRPVVVRNPPPPLPSPFAARQAILAQHPGRPVDPPAELGVRAQSAASASHPLVRAAAAAPSTPAAPASAAPARQPSRERLEASPSRPSSMAPPRQSPPATVAAPAVGANPSAAPAMPRVAPDQAARHAKERADLDARHAQERAALQAKHEQERQATDAAQRAQMQRRHQQEMKDLLAHQRAEREAAQKRQQEERKQKGSDLR